jgi:hypothetical protein
MFLLNELHIVVNKFTACLNIIRVKAFRIHHFLNELDQGSAENRLNIIAEKLQLQRSTKFTLAIASA